MDKFISGQHVRNTKTGQLMLVKKLYELHGKIYAACKLLEWSNRHEVPGRTGNRPKVTLGNLVAA